MHAECFCGNVIIEIDGTPDWVSYCHCRSCRKATGAPVAAYASFKNNVLSTKSGALKFYESSPGTKWGSCSICNSPVTYQSSKYPNDTHFHLITIDAHESLRPHSHVHFEEKVSWIDIADDYPTYDGSGPDE